MNWFKRKKWSEYEHVSFARDAWTWDVFDISKRTREDGAVQYKQTLIARNVLLGSQYDELIKKLEIAELTK